MNTNQITHQKISRINSLPDRFFVVWVEEFDRGISSDAVLLAESRPMSAVDGNDPGMPRIDGIDVVGEASPLGSQLLAVATPRSVKLGEDRNGTAQFVEHSVVHSDQSVK